jgi:hypothetical protein
MALHVLSLITRHRASWSSALATSAIFMLCALGNAVLFGSFCI